MGTRGMASFSKTVSRAGSLPARTVALLVVLMFCFSPGLNGQGGPQLVSVAKGGALANGSSHSAAASADGRYVAFMSNADNLTPHDENRSPDIFVRDLTTQDIVCVSLSPTGHTGGSASYSPCLSADGRFVAFESESANLVPDDTNGFADIFVYDLITGNLERASVSSLERQADLPCEVSSISGDGRFVAFESYATTLAPSSNPGVREIFVRDRLSGQTFIASPGLNGLPANGSSGNASFSLDGSRVAYHSWSDNLAPNDSNGGLDVFVYDLAADEVILASLTSEGLGANGPSTQPTLSGDGRLVAFHSDAHNLVPGDTNTYSDCFVRDLVTGQIEIVSLSTSGTLANEESGRAVITANGRLVVFHSHASNLVHNDSNKQQDIFVHNRVSGETLRVSANQEGVQGNFLSSWPWVAVLSGDIVFESWAENFFPGDVNQASDIFVRPLAGLLKPKTR